MAERWLAMHANSSRSNPRTSHDTHVFTSIDAEEHRSPASLRPTASLRSSELFGHEASPGRSDRAFRSGNERLYEAYNDLHALAQDFEKPFDAPAILVVGHQTDGKSGERLFSTTPLVCLSPFSCSVVCSAQLPREVARARRTDYNDASICVVIR